MLYGGTCYIVIHITLYCILHGSCTKCYVVILVKCYIVILVKCYVVILVKCNYMLQENFLIKIKIEIIFPQIQSFGFEFYFNYYKIETLRPFCTSRNFYVQMFVVTIFMITMYRCLL